MAQVCNDLCVSLAFKTSVWSWCGVINYLIIPRGRGQGLLQAGDPGGQTVGRSVSSRSHVVGVRSRAVSTGPPAWLDTEGVDRGRGLDLLELLVRDSPGPVTHLVRSVRVVGPGGRCRQLLGLLYLDVKAGGGGRVFSCRHNI